MPQTGQVKWFNNDRGFGFIVPNDGGTDVFVHIRDLHKAGLKTLAEGAAISYELGVSKVGKQQAIDLKLWVCPTVARTSGLAVLAPYAVALVSGS